MKTVDSSIIREVYRERKKWSKKGDFGRLLIIGGSKTYTGAPALAGLAALAALRSGVDLVTIAAPERPADVIARMSPNLITQPFRGDFFTPRHLKEIMKLSKKFDAISIGSGMGLEKETSKFVLKYIGKTSKPCVIDADAIKVLGNKRLGSNFVLTPHEYEFYSMTNEKPKQSITERSNLVKKVASKINSTILLKGAMDIISDGRNVAINRTGNPYMTTGGTGDVLTGICGSLLAQKTDPYKAACASA